MANTYTQLFIHIIFSPKNRYALIASQWENELHKYITGIVQNRNHKMLAINTMPDHLHMFIGLNPSESISGLVREIKKSSGRWINDQKLTPGIFYWQAGYGAFSHSHEQKSKVIEYIREQKHHHRQKTFREEYQILLKEFQVDFKEAFLFNFFCLIWKFPGSEHTIVQISPP